MGVTCDGPAVVNHDAEGQNQEVGTAAGAGLLDREGGEVVTSDLVHSVPGLRCGVLIVAIHGFAGSIEAENDAESTGKVC